MKKIVLILFLIFFCASNRLNLASAESELVKVPYTSAEYCMRVYNKMSSEQLFYLTLASLNANKFNVTTIQSGSGYILFEIAQKSFLANIAAIDNNSAFLKITPADNNYYFSSNMVNNIFYYINLNVNTPAESLVSGDRKIGF